MGERDEQGTYGIGSRRFWLAAATVAFIALVTLFSKYRSVTSWDAVVPVITLTGPTEAAPGETVRYAVLVRDRFGAPIADAPVRLGFSLHGLHEIGQAKTGSGGEATIEVRFPEDFEETRILLASSDVGTAEGNDSLEVSPREPGHGRVFVSTDKPLYQPGQTIHIRGLAMADDKPIAQRPATIEVTTEDQTKVFRVEKTTSEFGVVSADFVLADQVKLGSYRVTVATSVVGRKPKAKPGASADAIKAPEIPTAGAREVEVKRYSLPKMKLAFEDIEPVRADEPLVGKVRATWMFGEPVTNARVNVSLGTRVTAEGRLDREGRYRFELKPNPAVKPKDQPRGAFTLSARVTLDDGVTQDVTTTVATRERNAIKLEAFPESGVLIAGQKQNVYVVTTEGPVAGLTVKAEKLGEPAKTSERGIAKIHVAPPLPEKDKSPPPVKIVAYDEEGGEGAIDVPVRTDALVVRSDRSSYQAGDTVRVTVLGAEKGDRITLRMTKGAEPLVLGNCVVATEAAGCESSLVIPKGISGLVWMHALSLPGDKRPVRSGKNLALVGGGSRDLTLQLTPNKPSHTPREEGVVEVAVKEQGGAPVKAQLGVAVADEAVFALAEVRPDLEKIFFTIDQDFEQAKGSSGRSVPSWKRTYVSPPRMPPGTEPATVYDPSTDENLRGAILATLSTVRGAGAPAVSTTEELRSRGAMAVEDKTQKLGGWLQLLLCVLSLLAFGCFGAYGVARFRSADAELGAPADTETFRLETSALYLDWLVAVLGPPFLVGISGIASETLGGSVRNETVAGMWAALALFCCAFLLVRGVRRVRRTAVSLAAGQLRRSLVFLPVAAFLAHASILLMISDRGRKLEALFDIPKDAFLVPLAVIIAAQVASGFLSVIRATLLGPVTRRRRIWLLVSRPMFLGLPVSLGLVVFLLFLHVRARRTTWEEFAQEERESEKSAADSDNKEGGTGTRAKGEEGSMGNPNGGAGGGGKRYAVAGPKDNPGKPVITRDSFPETLLWAPEVITDDSGHATIKVPFEDSITTYRFGVKAVSRAGQLGSMTIPLAVKQDFFVDATMPPTLTQGDEIALPVTVFSYLSSPQDVVVSVSGDGFGTVGTSSTTIHLDPQQTRGFRFMVRAERAGRRTVRVQAIGPTRSDALERKIDVVPNGLALTQIVNGRATSTASTNATFPQRAIDGGNDLYAKIYGGPLSQVGEGLDGVFQLPHGCFEQTSSVTYPSILALDFLRRTKTVSPEIERRAREYIGLGIQRLLSFEVGTGNGFSLFGRSPGSTTLSAYGLMEFADLALVGHVDPSVIERTRSWLYSHRSSSGGWAKPSSEEKTAPEDLLTTAYIAWALTSVVLPGDKDTNLPGVLDRVAQASGPEADDPYALALRANALLAGGRAASARPLLDRLAAQAVRDSGGVHWTSKALGVLSSYGASLEIETTGLVAHAFAVAKRDPELRNGALDWLVTRRGHRGTWSTTPATIAAMRALLDEARPVPKVAQDVTVVVDGAPAETFRLEPNARDVHHLVSLRKWAATGEHVVEVRAANDADVSYQLVGQHYVPWQKTTGASPLALSVGYAPSNVAVGGVVTAHVRLSWTGAEPARMPIAAIAIPPAFEVDTTDLDKLVAREDRVIQRYTVERGQVTLYLVQLSRTEPVVVDLSMRSLRPVKVVAPASEAYLYYEPEVRVETPPVVLRAQ
jgi:hypothetical protein